ncbi:MAG: hypothetical protein ABI831_12800 [Betaproteobacteria bacterium]
MAVTQTQIDDLDAAMARGLLTVKDGTSTLTFQSIEDMLKARTALAGILASQENPSRGTPRYQLADFRDDR